MAAKILGRLEKARFSKLSSPLDPRKVGIQCRNTTQQYRANPGTLFSQDEELAGDQELLLEQMKALLGHLGHSLRVLLARNEHLNEALFPSLF